jgi:hypothetical protein
MVHFSLAGFFRWWNIEAAFEFRKIATWDPRNHTEHGHETGPTGRSAQGKPASPSSGTTVPAQCARQGRTPAHATRKASL